VIAMAVKAEVAAGDSTTYFDWAPVWAGSAVAVAITLVLTQFGTGVGLGAGETMVDETPPRPGTSPLPGYGLP
jgi:hypothetical protein